MGQTEHTHDPDGGYGGKLPAGTLFPVHRMTQQVSVGRVVHYRDVRYGPAHNAAIISGVNGDGSVNLTVFPDPLMTHPSGGPFVLGVTCVREGSPEEMQTWHWPEHVPAVPVEPS